MTDRSKEAVSCTVTGESQDAMVVKLEWSVMSEELADNHLMGWWDGAGDIQVMTAPFPCCGVARKP